MKYNDFKQKIIELNICINPENFPRGNDLIGISWMTGGRGGGSCWGDSEHYLIEGESEPEFNSLDLILENLVKDIPFIIYKKLKRELIRESEYHENDYYGNYTNYAKKWILLKELYQFLIDNKLI